MPGKALQVDSYIFNIITLPFFSHQQHHLPAGRGLQTITMPGVSNNSGYFERIEFNFAS